MSIDDERERIHREVWSLIPWWINGTASDDARRLCERHLPECADCRDEHALQSRIHAGLVDDAAATSDAHAAFARLLGRIDAEPQAVADTGRLPRSATERWLPALVAAVVVQAVGLVALAAISVHRAPATPAYTTLSATEASHAEATIRLVPAPTLSIGALHDLLAQNGLRIIDGSAERPIYSLAATRPINRGTTLERLRAHPGILLAEPIPGDAR